MINMDINECLTTCVTTIAQQCDAYVPLPSLIKDCAAACKRQIDFYGEATARDGIILGHGLVSQNDCRKYFVPPRHLKPEIDSRLILTTVFLIGLSFYFRGRFA